MGELTGKMTSTSSSADAELVDDLFRTFRSIQLHGRHHPQGSGAAAQFVAKVSSRLPLTLTFVVGGAFADGSMIPLTFESWQRLVALAEPLKAMGINELVMRVGLIADEVLAVGTAWSEGARGNRFALDELGELNGFGFRGLDGVSRGNDVEVVDRDVAVVAEAALAVRDAERIATSTEPWTLQTLIVRRLERTVFERPHAALVAFEQSTPTVARRAVSSALLAGALLRHVGATAATTRAGAHAALVTSLAGLRERGGLSFGEARRAGLALVLGHPWGRSGIEPHRLRVAALMLAGAEAHPVLGPVGLAYQTEVRRCPENLTFDMTNADLWAALAARAGIDFPLPWVRALVDCFGAVPAGAWVRLADKRVGLVLGPSDKPGRPLLLIDGVPVAWDGEVKLLSAAEVRS